MSRDLHRKRGPDFVEWVAILVMFIVFTFGFAAGRAWGGTVGLSSASWYGPGLYGNALACGGHLRYGSWGVAHRYLPCGSRIKLCYGYRCTVARIIDRGPFVYGREFDLTGPVARYLCRCSSWGVRTVAWHRL